MVLYSIGCPKCRILEDKLKKYNINYEVSTDMDELINLGFDSMPILKVEDKYMNFNQAVLWLKENYDEVK